MPIPKLLPQGSFFVMLLTPVGWTYVVICNTACFMGSFLFVFNWKYRKYVENISKSIETISKIRTKENLRTPIENISKTMKKSRSSKTWGWRCKKTKKHLRKSFLKLRNKKINPPIQNLNFLAPQPRGNQGATNSIPFLFSLKLLQVANHGNFLTL